MLKVLLCSFICSFCFSAAVATDNVVAIDAGVREMSEIEKMDMMNTMMALSTASSSEHSGGNGDVIFKDKAIEQLHSIESNSPYHKKGKKGRDKDEIEVGMPCSQCHLLIFHLCVEQENIVILFFVDVYRTASTRCS